VPCFIDWVSPISSCQIKKTTNLNLVYSKGVGFQGLEFLLLVNKKMSRFFILKTSFVLM